MINIKADEKLNKLNHSCAHLLAQAVKHLYPEAKFWVGPVIEEGFYYDIDLGDKVIVEEDLPKIEKEIGAENIVEHEVDLLSLDGSDKWGKVNCKVSLPTFDFYRKNVKVFDKHKLDDWWWLVTPDSTSEHYSDNWLVCVSSFGFIDYDYYYGIIGVRPFLTFVSSISFVVSSVSFSSDTSDSVLFS